MSPAGTLCISALSSLPLEGSGCDQTIGTRRWPRLLVAYSVQHLPPSLADIETVNTLDDQGAAAAEEEACEAEG